MASSKQKSPGILPGTLDRGILRELANDPESALMKGMMEVSSESVIRGAKRRVFDRAKRGRNTR